RVLVLSREIDDLIDFRSSDFPHVRTAHSHSFPMHLQHHLRRLLAAHRENSLQHDNDKVHWRVVVVEEHYLVQRRRLDSGFLGLEYPAVLLLVRHFPLRAARPWMCLWLMIATDISRGIR